MELTTGVLKMKVFLLNDTENQKHAGCTLTMYTIKRLCAAHDMIIIGTVPTGMKVTEFYKDMEKADLIIVNGEGSIHDNNRNELIHVASHFPSVLINTVYHNQLDLPAMQDFLYIAARETESANAIKVKCEVVPDVCFASDLLELPPTVPVYEQGCTDSCIAKEPGDITINCSPLAYATKLRAHKSIVTGRFHGAVFCAMLGIPFSCYPSNTHKIQGLCKDMGIEEHYHLNKATAMHNCPKKINDNVRKYIQTASVSIHNMFKNLKKKIN